jgi:hypothetical protein
MDVAIAAEHTPEDEERRDSAERTSNESTTENKFQRAIAAWRSTFWLRAHALHR